MELYLDKIPQGSVCNVLELKGEGAFRHRLLEMGFVRGATVKVIKNAPLLDPIEYEILGSHVSLRRSEAANILVTHNEVEDSLLEAFYGTELNNLSANLATVEDSTVVALVGNPNCGKTSLFNYLTGLREKTGNYGGVTVDCKIGAFYHGEEKIKLVDLPGTYSLTEFSPEELYVRTFVENHHPQVILNIVDACNLERNLYLSTQLMDMGVPIVMALNMYDEFQKSGDKLDIEALSNLLGIPIIPIVAKSGAGVELLVESVSMALSGIYPQMRCVNYGEEIETSITKIQAICDDEHEKLSRYDSLKLLEGDKHAFMNAKSSDVIVALRASSNKIRENIEKRFDRDIASIISDLKYGFVRGALKECLTKNVDNTTRLGYAFDEILTNRWLGFPILLFFMWVIFQATFTLGAYPQEWIEMGVGGLGNLVSGFMAPGVLQDLIVDGIIAGVGGVIVFLPNILILFLFISLLEDSGYMARAAFIVDRIMHKIGLHGKSFIPYLIGFGCGVPAIMATRTLENRRDRIITILTIPFMSCSARLPVYLLFVSAFFVAHQGLVLMSIYLVGIMAAAITALVLSKTIMKKESVQFVMELPPYRMPTWRNTTAHMWNKGSQYIRKMGTVILMASIIIWALGYFPNHNSDMSVSQRVESSYIGQMGKAIEPVVEPLGFDWKMGVSVITGMAAKEIVVSTMGILYAGNDDVEDSAPLIEKLKSHSTIDGQPVFSPLKAYSFMVFILLYFPCIAALAAIRREAGGKWAAFAVFYTTAFAWITSFLIYQIGGLIL